MILNQKKVIEICSNTDGLYPYPELNEKIYLNNLSLHGLGDGLKEFKNLETLYLQENMLANLDGLESQFDKLRNLFLQSNQIQDVNWVKSFKNLRRLNLSENLLESVDCKLFPFSLRELDLSKNQIVDIVGLESLQGLEILHLSGNKISDEGIMEQILSLQNLRYVTLSGNPFVGKVKNYRKMLITGLDNLSFLDSNPVSENDRRLATAFLKDGVHGERMERELIRVEQSKKDLENFTFLEQQRS